MADANADSTRDDDQPLELKVQGLNTSSLSRDDLIDALIGSEYVQIEGTPFYYTAGENSYIVKPQESCLDVVTIIVDYDNNERAKISDFNVVKIGKYIKKIFDPSGNIAGHSLTGLDNIDGGAIFRINLKVVSGADIPESIDIVLTEIITAVGRMEDLHSPRYFMGPKNIHKYAERMGLTE